MRGELDAAMMRRERGLSLLEVLMASLITTIVAAGTMSAIVASARMMRARNNPQRAEGVAFAQETLERHRNDVIATFVPPAGWQTEALPGGVGPNTESIVNRPPIDRRYRIQERLNCDGNAATVGDRCYVVETRVCWDQVGC